MKKIDDKNLINLIKENFPKFVPYFESYESFWGSDNGITIQMMPLVKFAVELIKTNDQNEIKRLFEFIEFLMRQGNDLVQAAIATGFLEGLLNKDPEEIQFIKFRQYLGKETLSHCRAWDEFTGVMTKGLHDD